MRIFWYIYIQPLGRIVGIMALVLLLWTGVLAALGRVPVLRRRLCLAGALAYVPVILVLTVLRRSPGEASVMLLPLHSLAAARAEPEIYRSMLMNVFLFFPLGLLLPTALAGRRRPVLRALLLAAALSVLIEACQGIFRLGDCETDDVLMNLMGTAVGTLSCLARFRKSQ